MSLKTRLLLLLLSFTSIATPFSNVQAQPGDGPTPRIIGGIDATPGDYPWMVALLRSNIAHSFNAQFCGGTLIADRWVMTAAHCVDGFSSASEIEVAIGISDLDTISTRTAVNTIFVHPGYNVNTQDNDMALLELATPSSNATLAIADNTLTNSIVVGDLMTVIGWGTTSADPQIPGYPNLLQETDIPLFDFATCNDINHYDSSLTDNMICAAGSPSGGQDTCSGDSGGPMLYFNSADSTYYQTGVTSFGNGCAVPDEPGVYTRAANYIDWINNTTAVSFPNQHPFGFHGVGYSTSATLTLRNYSGADITVSGLSLDNVTHFSITSETCSAVIIANDSSCTVTLHFQASSAETHLATLNIDLGSGATLSSAISGIGLAAINASALDEFPARTWYSGGDASWASVNIANSNGGTAMRSGPITDNMDTALLSYFTGPDTLSFRWKASSEQNYDFLKLYIDGVLIDSISGDQDWEQRNIGLSSGEHRIAWVYEKDITVNELQDSGWLDSVNTSYTSNTDPGDPVETRGFGGGGSFSGFFILLLTVMFTLRRMHSQRIRWRVQ